MSDRKVFVLVHGAWHGGWCWKKLVPLLREAGHEVHVPTLTGMGERLHLLDPKIDLAMHVQDVLGVLEYEDLRNVFLVGHSYGGMVVTGAFALASERIAHVVYLDAFLPENGKSLADYTHLPPVREDGWRVTPRGPPEAFGVTDPQDVAWMAPRMGDQPILTLTQGVDIPANVVPARGTYIRCSDRPHFNEAGERARRRGYAYFEMLEAGHNAMVTKPRELAELLLVL